MLGRRTLAPLAATLLLACNGAPEIVRRAPTDGDLWIRGANVIDVVTGSVAASRDVRITEGRIAEILPSGSAPASARAVDGRGASLVPGLIDAHIHLGNTADPPWTGPVPDPALNLQRLLYSGVTTVLETGGMASPAFERRAAVERGELVGPRIFTAGPIFTAPGGHPIPMLSNGLPWWIEWYVVPRMTRQIDSPAAASEAVDALLPSRPDVVKIVLDRIPERVPVMSTEVARAIVERARAGGVRTVAHIGSTADALDAARAGVAAWVHGVYKEQIPDEKIAELAGFGIPMVPTLVVFESYATTGREPRAPTDLERALVAPDVLAAFDHPPPDLELPEGGKEMLDALAKLRGAGLSNVRRLHEAGVVMIAGSDAQTGVYHGPGLHRELALLAQAGLTPLEVLRAATLNAARFIARHDDPPFGVIAAGKEADLLLVEGDPLEDVSALSRIRAVIARGQLIERRGPHESSGGGGVD